MFTQYNYLTNNKIENHDKNGVRESLCQNWQYGINDVNITKQHMTVIYEFLINDDN